MRSRIAVFFSVLLSFVLVAAIALYLLAAYRYKSGFSYGTVINGHACAGLSVEEVNNILLSDMTADSVMVNSSFKEGEEILFEDFDFKADYSTNLENVIFRQTPLLWGLNLFYGREGIGLIPDISYNSFKLRDCVKGLSVVREYDEDYKGEVAVKLGESGYYLYDSTKKVLYTDLVCELIESSLSSREYSVSVPNEWIVSPLLSDEEKAEKASWDEVSSFISRVIVFDMGAEKISVDSVMLSGLLVKTDSGFKHNTDGSLYFDSDKVEAFVDDLCDRYETYSLPREFVSVNGEEKHLEKSTYGTRIDREAEKEYLLTAIKEGKSETHIPKYIHKGYVRGLDDIGPTRIEVDLTRQKLYYIENGRVDMECDIVSGNPHKYKPTPEMVCSVVRKTEDTILKGEGYRSHVNYWMAIYKTSIGIHDATWQRVFGGERYLTHGSHGCINMKLKEAEELYGKIEVGVPVLVYK